MCLGVVGDACRRTWPPPPFVNDSSRIFIATCFARSRRRAETCEASTTRGRGGRDPAEISARDVALHEKRSANSRRAIVKGLTTLAPQRSRRRTSRGRTSPRTRPSTTSATVATRVRVGLRRRARRSRRDGVVRDAPRALDGVEHRRQRRGVRVSDGDGDASSASEETLATRWRRGRRAGCARGGGSAAEAPPRPRLLRRASPRELADRDLAAEPCIEPVSGDLAAAHRRDSGSSFPSPAADDPSGDSPPPRKRPTRRAPRPTSVPSPASTCATVSMSARHPFARPPRTRRPRSRHHRGIPPPQGRWSGDAGLAKAVPSRRSSPRRTSQEALRIANDPRALWTGRCRVRRSSTSNEGRIAARSSAFRQLVRPLRPPACRSAA